MLFIVACTTPATNSPDDSAVDSSSSVDDGDPRLRACLEESGYNYNEVWPPWSSPEPPLEGSVFADPQFWLDFESCLVESGISEGPVFEPERIAEDNREMLEYVRCMNERGWNLPEPEPSTDPLHPGLLDFPTVELQLDDQETMDQYHRDSAECGIPFFDENDNLLPLGG